VEVLLTSLMAEPVIVQKQELASRAACDVNDASGNVHVGMDIWLVQILMM